MIPSRFSAGERPLFYVGNLPVHVTTLLLAIHLAVMVGLAIGGPRAGQAAVELFGFYPEDVLERGKIWQPVSYVFLTFPSLGSAIGLVFFFLFGRPVEGFFGPGVFVKLYAFLAVIPALLLLLADAAAVHGFGASFLQGRMAGPWIVHTCVFLAFAFLYPGAVFLFGLLAKWIAAFIVVLHTLVFLFARDWPGLLALWSSIVLTYFLLRSEGLSSRFPAIEAALGRMIPSRETRGRKQSKRRLRVVEAQEPERERAKRAMPQSGERAALPRRRAARREQASDGAGIDDLLEKISREGIQSLTEEERRKLESASSRLARRERSGP
ncbi:MAG TPA: DUF6576 domain-containing protein [Verrucomicrobiales bacterium]|nr:DUF6576 domain-containing protein [Verrucomicrobiales bacterium]